MAPAAPSRPRPIGDAELATLHDLLEGVPPPLEPLDPGAIDGYLCGVLVQPRPVPERAWWKHVLDIDGRAAPPGFDPAPLRALVRRRHAELAAAIGGRRWFDPWIFAADDAGSEVEAVLPWATGFVLALETFDALLGSDDPATLEPLALVYAHVGADHLEDADALLAEIEALEPPADLTTAVEELVRATLLLADVAGLPRTR